MTVPFHRPSIDEAAINEVVATLRSGWLTTGPKTKEFEAGFASYIGVRHAVALNSATAALHLALEAIGLSRGDAVLVPTMTFAATAEVVRYFDAKPILVDCDIDSGNLDCEDARVQALAAIKRGERVRAIIPVHYGGCVVDMSAVLEIAGEFNLVVIEDAAHCCPARYRHAGETAWRMVGTESAVSCFSFYANKCITTGEGGMACTNDDRIADRMRVMALHGISKDAWKRFTSEGSWDYEIVAPGFKYNLTDIASSLGIHQLRRADELHRVRAGRASRFHECLSGVDEIALPVEPADRVHSWHLYAIRLRTETIGIGRAEFIEELKRAGIGTSVHWRPLHMHPYYVQTYGYKPEDFPKAALRYEGLISLPFYPDMTDSEIDYVAATIRDIISANKR